MRKTREQLEQEEKSMLATYAVKSAESRGRRFPEKEDPYRLCFQRDRDRIIHAKSFRRLKAKTQVFIEHYGDHYRTRLTHTLEVAQIARDIARTLSLNEDLSEAIALAHDLGHTPFGHMGEEALDACLRPFELHFEHNEQSKRIVEKLENLYPDFPGLNLTQEVREGLIKHRTAWDNPHFDTEVHPSLEAQVVNLSDEIAYQNHDIDDGLRSGILKWEDVAKLELCRDAILKVETQYGEISDKDVHRARIVSKMIGLMIHDLYEITGEKLKNVKTIDDVYCTDDPIICFSEKMAGRIRELREFLTKNFYFHPTIFRAAETGKKIIQNIFEKYHAEPKLLPKKLQHRLEKGDRKEEIIRDFIAGMTDGFAEEISLSS